MSDGQFSGPRKAALGADLIIPALAVGFTLYFFSSIWDLSWEAKANGVVIGTALLALIAVMVIRIFTLVARGEATLGLDKISHPWTTQGRRVGMIAVTILFIALLPVLGFTLGLFAGMAAALWVMGVRDMRGLFGTAFGVAATCYLLFILLLDTRFPRGPVENLLAGLL